MAQQAPSRVEARALIKSVHGIRYQTKDVARAVAFYTNHLGFTLKHQQLPAFANVALGDTDILLSGPGASGSREMPNGQRQEPGGWNRVVLKVADLPTCVAALKSVRDFRQGLRSRICLPPRPSSISLWNATPIELFDPAR